MSLMWGETGRNEDMNTHEIVKDWLDSHGFDGLVNVETECGCGGNSLNDLYCGDYCPYRDCEAAIKRECDCGSYTYYPVGATEFVCFSCGKELKGSEE